MISSLNPFLCFSPEYSLAQTRITDSGVIQLCANIPSLEVLNLSRCAYITDTAVLAICGSYCRTLRTVDVANCHKVTDSAIRHLLKTCRKLETMDASRLPCRDLSDMLWIETEIFY
uniref:Uncharacterized protein n=1 Tax=Timspurckia oligopyrenoides TaxID=708627 RepID=A0A7S0ZC77_9RHOD|mmetsp:Transcript_12206/g.22071  ORF Transcript_12206/g.22071 Transcript_12206/m.22071 type:complete len:116 (+) Transcript_12206:103-450(+)